MEKHRVIENSEQLGRLLLEAGSKIAKLESENKILRDLIKELSNTSNDLKQLIIDKWNLQ